jgi:hypothetical protein
MPTRKVCVYCVGYLRASRETNVVKEIGTALYIACLLVDTILHRGLRSRVGCYYITGLKPLLIPSCSQRLEMLNVQMKQSSFQ